MFGVEVTVSYSNIHSAYDNEAIYSFG